MPEIALEERVAHLEGKVDEQSRLGSDVRERLTQLDQRLTSRLDSLDQKLSTQCRWLIGIMVAVLLAVIGVLLRFSPA